LIPQLTNLLWQQKIETEDWLFDFVFSCIASDRVYLSLLEFVRFDFLTSSAMQVFISWSLDHFDEFTITPSLWQRITARLSLNVTPAHGNEAISRWISGGGRFVPNPDSPLNGIIASLPKSHDGKVHDLGIVGITASSFDSPLVPKNAADLQQQNYFQVMDKPGQWLKYDFKDRRIWLTHYSIAAHTNGWFLRSWVVEGSTDGGDNSWVVLDTHTNNTEAHMDHPIATFSVPRSEVYRFIRLRQTGKVANGREALIIVAFEMFGCLVE
jgi:hypothetical protein